MGTDWFFLKPRRLTLYDDLLNEPTFSHIRLAIDSTFTDTRFYQLAINLYNYIKFNKIFINFFLSQTKIEKNTGKIVNDLVDIDFEQTVMK